MAIRYSGDVEVRIREIRLKGQRAFYANFRVTSGRASLGKRPYRAAAVSSFREMGVGPRARLTPATYDQAAMAFLAWAQQNERGRLPLDMDRKGKIVLRRIFQSPCPE